MMTKKQLQERVKDLEDRLREVCVNPKSVRSKLIVYRENFKYNLESELWRGSQVKTGQSFNGLLKQIKVNE